MSENWFHDADESEDEKKSRSNFNAATSLNDQAMSLMQQGDYAAAGPLYRRVLAIREASLDPENENENKKWIFPLIAASLGNLANVLQAQGDYAAAEASYRRELAIWEKAYGLQHPYVASTLRALTGLLRTQGQYAQAEPLFNRALTILEYSFLDPYSSEVIFARSAMAAFCREIGKEKEAESLEKWGFDDPLGFMRE